MCSFMDAGAWGLVFHVLSSLHGVDAKPGSQAQLAKTFPHRSLSLLITC